MNRGRRSWCHCKWMSATLPLQVGVGAQWYGLDRPQEVPGAPTKRSKFFLPVLLYSACENPWSNAKVSWLGWKCFQQTIVPFSTCQLFPGWQAGGVNKRIKNEVATEVLRVENANIEKSLHFHFICGKWRVSEKQTTTFTDLCLAGLELVSQKAGACIGILAKFCPKITKTANSWGRNFRFGVHSPGPHCLGPQGFPYMSGGGDWSALRDWSE